MKSILVPDYNTRVLWVGGGGGEYFKQNVLMCLLNETELKLRKWVFQISADLWDDVGGGADVTDPLDPVPGLFRVKRIWIFEDLSIVDVTHLHLCDDLTLLQ